MEGIDAEADPPLPLDLGGKMLFYTIGRFILRYWEQNYIQGDLYAKNQCFLEKSEGGALPDSIEIVQTAFRPSGQY